MIKKSPLYSDYHDQQVRKHNEVVFRDWISTHVIYQNFRDLPVTSDNHIFIPIYEQLFWSKEFESASYSQIRIKKVPIWSLGGTLIPMEVGRRLFGVVSYSVFCAICATSTLPQLINIDSIHPNNIQHLLTMKPDYIVSNRASCGPSVSGLNAFTASRTEPPSTLLLSPATSAVGFNCCD